MRSWIDAFLVNLKIKIFTKLGMFYDYLNLIYQIKCKKLKMVKINPHLTLNNVFKHYMGN